MSVVIVENEPDVHPGRLATLLPDARVLRMHETPGAIADLLDAHDRGGALPDGIVVLGGRPNAYADELVPWLADAKELLRRAVRADVRVLGICLGHQLLAVATGGEVEVGASAGPEYGVTGVFWDDSARVSPLGLALAGIRVAFEDHGDAVTRIPEGAEVWATSDKYPQVIRLGSALGVQFHPEVDRELVAAWQATNERTDTEEILAGYDAAEPELVALCELLAGWVATGNPAL